jgi:hypothetical protein
MTCAPAARAAAFKQCCLKAGRYDGVQRDDYFSRMNSLVAFHSVSAAGKAAESAITARVIPRYRFL